MVLNLLNLDNIYLFEFEERPKTGKIMVISIWEGFKVDVKDLKVPLLSLFWKLSAEHQENLKKKNSFALMDPYSLIQKDF